MTETATSGTQPPPLRSTTRAQQFGYRRNLNRHLFQVLEGGERQAAVDEAHVILCCALEVLNRSGEDGLSSDQALLLAFNLDTALALYRAAGLE